MIANRYQVVEEIGAGGMGTVYRVRDTLLGNKEIALKTLLEEFAREKAYVERFIREIELMNQVHHPNVVRTYDIGTDGKLIYFTMEIVEGISLDDLLDKGPLPIKDAPRLLIQICRGLHAIHNAEIIHRDLKPGNIMLLSDGSLKITDFGVARPKNSALTKKNERVGSIWYMAPETWKGGELTRATDLYSLGILIFESLTGQLPFDSDHPGELMQMHIKKPPPPLRAYRKDIPVWLEKLVLKLLEKDPKKRPKTAKHLVELVSQNASNVSARASASSDDLKMSGSSAQRAAVGHSSSSSRNRSVAKSSNRSGQRQQVQPRSSSPYKHSTSPRKKHKKSFHLWKSSPISTVILLFLCSSLAASLFVVMSQSPEKRTPEKVPVANPAVANQSQSTESQSQDQSQDQDQDQNQDQSQDQDQSQEQAQETKDSNKDDVNNSDGDGASQSNKDEPIDTAAQSTESNLDDLSDSEQ